MDNNIYQKLLNNTAISANQMGNNNDPEVVNIDDDNEPFSETSEQSCERKRSKKTVKCTICLEEFKNSLQLKEHMKNEHESEGVKHKQTTCKVCGKQWATPYQLKKHVLIHSSERPFVCEICNKGFVYKGNLNIHKKIHSKQKNLYHQNLLQINVIKNIENITHTIEEQGAVNENRNLNCRNIIIKTKGNVITLEPVKTDVIDLADSPYMNVESVASNTETQDFDNATNKIEREKQYENLSSVSDKPFDIRSFVCEICSKCFKHRELLTEHMKVHNVETSMCKVCGKKLTTQYLLKNHMRMHSSERPFVCKICGKGFRHHSNVIEHHKKCKNKKPERLNEAHKQSTAEKQGDEIETYDLETDTDDNEDVTGSIEISTHNSESENDEIETMIEKMDTLEENNYTDDFFSNKFVCDVCDLHTKYKDALIEHLKTHTITETACLVCGKKYSKVKTHTQMHENGETLVCENCNESLRYQGNLTDVKNINAVNKNENTKEIQDVETASKDTTIANDVNNIKNTCNMDVQNVKIETVSCKEGQTQDKSQLDVCNKPHEKVPFSCEYCNTSFNFMTGLIKHMKTHSKKKTCKICSKELNNRYLLENHMQVHSNKRPYACRICNKSYKYQSNLIEHIGTHGKKKRSRQYRLRMQLNSKTCEICGKELNNRYLLENHMRMHNNDRPYACKFCSKAFKYQSNVIEHMRRSHKNTSVVKNVELDVDSATNNVEKQDVENAIDNVEKLDVENATDNVEKVDVENAINDVENATNNVEIHGGENTANNIEKFECASYYIEKLNVKNAHHNILMPSNRNSFVCEICSMSFKYKIRLITHMKIHLKLKCQVCGKELNNLYLLENHMRMHTNERPYVCRICNKTYKYHSNVIEHMRKTHKKRKFLSRINVNKKTCGVCGKELNSQYLLVNHMRIHNNKRPYVCKICSKGFKTLAGLTQHVRCKHKKKNYDADKIESDIPQNISKNVVHPNDGNSEHIHDNQETICNYCDQEFPTPNVLKKHLSVNKCEGPFVCKICNVAFQCDSYLTAHMQTNRHKYKILNTAAPENNEITAKCVDTVKQNVDVESDVEADNVESDIEADNVESDDVVSDNAESDDVETDNVEADNFEINGDVMDSQLDSNDEIVVKDEITEEVTLDPVINIQSINKELDFSDPLNTNIDDSSSPFKCDLCDKKFTHANGFLKHRRVHTKKQTYFCLFCSGRFSDGNSLKLHMKSVHSNIKNYECDLEDSKPTSIVRKHDRDYYRKTRINNGHFECEVCKMNFIKQSDLQTHTKIHSDSSKLFKCQFCDIVCKDTYQFEQHILHKHSNRNICAHKKSNEDKMKSNCKIRINANFIDYPNFIDVGRVDSDQRCKKSLENYSNYSIDSSNLTEDLNNIDNNLYECDTCGKKYNCKIDLIKHIKIQCDKPESVCKDSNERLSDRDNCSYTSDDSCNSSNVMQFMCDICNKKFPTKSTLDDHITEEHANVKLHECGICGKQFSMESCLTIHMAVHSVDKPFKCEMCGAQFGYNTHLKFHMLTVHTKKQ